MEFGRSPSFKKRKRSKLGLLPLVALIFYEVSGGPFGTEVGHLKASLGCLAPYRVASLPFYRACCLSSLFSPMWSLAGLLGTGQLFVAFCCQIVECYIVPAIEERPNVI